MKICVAVCAALASVDLRILVGTLSSLLACIHGLCHSNPSHTLEPEVSKQNEVR